MEELVEIPLGQEGIDYIRERLVEGKTVAGHVLEHIDLRRGSARTLLPDYVPATAVKLFKEGVLYRDPRTFRYEEGKDGGRYRIEPVPTLNESLVARISSLLPTRSWIFEEDVGHPSDPWVQRVTDRSWMLLGEEIYWVIDKNADSQRVEATVRDANSAYPGLLAFGVSQHDLSLVGIAGGEMNASAPEVIVHHLAELVVGAYDGEAFIYWTPA